MSPVKYAAPVADNSRYLLDPTIAGATVATIPLVRVTVVLAWENS
jgi:hypothetical protein